MPSITPAKHAYEEHLIECLTKYSHVLFVGMDNVRSQQVHEVRRALRGKAEFVMGKKTLQAKIVHKRAHGKHASPEAKHFAELCEQHDLLSGNTGLVFTNNDVQEITAVLDAHRVKAPARVGAIAPCDVVVPAGNTGMEPTQTSFFQALNIATKIAKGMVEIVTEKKVLSTGDKVDNSTATLLQKLNISPFYYQVEVLTVFDRGVLFTRDDLKITEDSIEQMLIEGLSNVSAMSLGAGIPTPATIGHMVVDAFKNLLAISVATSYEFEEHNGKELREAAINGTLAGAGGAAEEAAAAPAAAAGGAAAKKEETEEDEEEDFGMGGLF
ncbi:putative 60S acidic ribosomal subunit protein [Leptomonas pyrrhocoris]|uniref:60S acidic ribosomal protein P0 n=1 Tax=Leptomonas pyrrhocoris TaxID=157538 RepID=A0A0M9G2S6_LEPPY|nr:putative 60S acidic ribosomal subunit protein [Leptomonas pyrrhocoris]KPA80976.1 putative 60S acidic ribosomal subunit protein [Leptomonas pyrrhocoris]|eukprot:XP_015659415.1 putative 60S acidic ribosomal subunit protein [Leptomonas pyrrhocoris]